MFTVWLKKVQANEMKNDGEERESLPFGHFVRNVTDYAVEPKSAEAPTGGNYNHCTHETSTS